MSFVSKKKSIAVVNLNCLQKQHTMHKKCRTSTSIALFTSKVIFKLGESIGEKSFRIKIICRLQNKTTN